MNTAPCTMCGGVGHSIGPFIGEECSGCEGTGRERVLTFDEAIAAMEAVLEGREPPDLAPLNLPKRKPPHRHTCDMCLQSSECENPECADPALFSFRLRLCTDCEEAGGFWGRVERDQVERE